MAQKIVLNREIIKRIDDVLMKFDKVEFFTLIDSGSNGIGSTLDMVFSHNINGFETKVEIPLITVDDW